MQERFWSKVLKTDGCWLWQASINVVSGYGQFSYQGRPHAAHRIAWLLEYGEMPELLVLHECDVRACVRPSHLFLGTHVDNMRDMAKKGRYGTIRPHVVGEQHGNAKLTWEIVRAARQGGLSGAEFARLHDIDQSHACRILRNEAWVES